jgi:hypothetical protein
MWGLPKSLDALAPKYLAKIPDDYFTGKPLPYRPNENGYLLYSFGMNGKDDGGQGREVFHQRTTWLFECRCPSRRTGDGGIYQSVHRSGGTGEMSASNGRSEINS